MQLHLLVWVGSSAVTASPGAVISSIGGSSTNRTLAVDDPNFGKVNRTFVLHVPPKLSAAPSLVVGFHGQSGVAWSWALGHSYDSFSDRDGWVVVYPQGVADVDDKGRYDSGWNVGTNGDNSTCLPGTTGTACHVSCRRRRLCGRCAWSHCYDDVAFISQLLSALSVEFPSIDKSRMYAVGESNGGMLVHHLAQSLTGVFAAVVPVFALPLLGYMVGGQYELVQRIGLARAPRRLAPSTRRRRSCRSRSP